MATDSSTTMKEPVRKGILTISSYLIRCYLLGALPLILLAFVLAGLHIYNLQTNFDREARGQVHNIAKTVDIDLSARIAALQILAASFLIDDQSRLEEFYVEAQNFRKRFDGHVILADKSTQMLIYTRVPFGSGNLPKLPVPKGFAAAPAVLKTGKPQVGDMFYGAIAGEPLVAVVVPITRRGEIRGLLLSIIETRRYQKILDDLVLHAGYSLTIYDSKKEILAHRSRTNLQQALGSRGAEKKFEADSAISFWSVTLDMPSSMYNEPIIINGVILLLGIIFIVIISIVGARRVRRHLSHSVESLLTKTPVAKGPLIAEIEHVRDLMKEDETARVASAELLQETSRRFSTLISNVPGMVYRCANTSDWKMEFVSEGCKYITGYQPEDLIGNAKLSYAQIIHPEDRQMVFDKVQIAIAKQRPFEFTYRILDSEGNEKRVWEHGRGVFDPASKLLALEGFIVDVTQRMAEQEIILESKLQLEMAIQASNTGLWDWDLRTDKVYFSPEWKRQIGYDEDEISNDFSEWQERVHPDDLEQTVATVHEFINNPYPNYECEFRFRHKDGSYRWILARASLLYDEQEKPIRMLGSHQDITDRKRTEQELQQHRDNLEKLVQERTEKLQLIVNLMSDREIKMAELKKEIGKLRRQLEDEKHGPMDDPLDKSGA